MCLTTSNRNFKEADGDIVCYKFATLDKDMELCAPYRRDCYYIRGCFHEEKCFQTEAKPCNSPVDKFGYKRMLYYVDVGWHSLTSIDDCKYYGFKDGRDYVILRCIIPKGARYYEGEYGGKPAYCSDKIIIDVEEKKTWFQTLKSKILNLWRN